MSKSETVNPPVFPAAMEVFFQALILADNENAHEIGIDHLLAALDSSTTATDSVEHPAGPFVPAPHRGKPLSAEVKKAFEGAGVLAHES